MSVFRWRRYLSAAMLSFIASAASLATSVAAQAADDPLTLAEAQRLAVLQSEKLAASRHTRAAASELTPAAGQLADPVLQFGVDNVPVNGPDAFSVDADLMTMTRVGVMQEFTRGDKRRLRTERAELNVAMADAEQYMTQAQVERATALAWLDAYFTERRVGLIESLLSEAQAAAAAADSAFAQGRKTAVDALAERAMVIESQDRLTEARVKERTARIALARWIGAESQRRFAEPPAFRELPLHGHGDLAVLEAELREHPDIVLLDKQLELARTDAALARAERQSDWSVELMYGKRGAQFDDMVSLGVSIPLQLNRGSRQNRELASALALASAAKAQRDDMYREHVAEVRAMLDEWNSTRERLLRYANDMTPLAKDRTLAAEAAYRGGKAMLEDLIAARRNEVVVALQTIALEQELARLWAELSFLGTTNQVASISNLEAMPAYASSPPSWGRDRERGNSFREAPISPPSPQPSPIKGEGAEFGVAP